MKVITWYYKFTNEYGRRDLKGILNCLFEFVGRSFLDILRAFRALSVQLHTHYLYVDTIELLKHTIKFCCALKHLFGSAKPIKLFELAI